ncbi:MAG: ssDNA-binding domain-containing protein [Deltaproteobacteria bacterium]|jgi:antirestriction protein ArdC|nr:ssDNA-binding domain-containing protein [Deltaproteobacteria bacterium]
MAESTDKYHKSTWAKKPQGNSSSSRYRYDSPRVTFAEKIIALIEKGVPPWKKPWVSVDTAPPFNPVSKTIYRGVNKVALSGTEYLDPRWMSFKQANSIGYRVKSGERSTVIEFWMWGEKLILRDNNGKPLLDGTGKYITSEIELTRPRVRYYHVFNMTQLVDREQNPPPPYVRPVGAFEPIEIVERILEKAGAKLVFDQKDKCYYSLERDEIHLTPKSSFLSAENYYATVLHELAHWTRHGSRLNRENIVERVPDYAREELRAEMASWMLALDLNLPYTLENHASYLAHWVSLLKNEPHEINLAAVDAEKIKQYILSFVPDFTPDFVSSVDNLNETQPELAHRPYSRANKSASQKSAEDDEEPTGHQLPPEENPPLPREAGLELPEIYPSNHVGVMDLTKEDKPRALLMNSLFGKLLYPGLLREETSRWAEVAETAASAQEKTWSRTHKMAIFLEEVLRISTLAVERANKDRIVQAPQRLREIHAYNHVLAIIHYARKNHLPYNLLMPQSKDYPLYSHIALRPRASGEDSFPVSIGGKQIDSFAFAKKGEKATRHVVISLENLEVLGVFYFEENALDFAASLGSFEERYMGGDELALKEMSFLISGQYQDKEFPSALGNGFHGPLPEELRCFWNRIERKAKNIFPGSDYTPYEKAFFKWMRDSGQWRKHNRPVTFDFIPEELKLGFTDRPVPEWTMTKSSELPPTKVEIFYGNGTEVPEVVIVDETPDLVLKKWEASLEKIRDDRRLAIELMKNKRDNLPLWQEVLKEIGGVLGEEKQPAPHDKAPLKGPTQFLLPVKPAGKKLKSADLPKGPSMRPKE